MQLISPVFKKMPVSHKMSYISVMAALSVIVNMYSIDIAGGLIKMSFVGVVCIISGAIFGPVYGFAIGFLGDAISFLVSASGYAYSPLIGLSNGFYAAIAGLVFMIFKNRSLILKIIIAGILTYFICTLLITSLGIFLLFGSRYTFWAYMLRRVIFQSPVSLVNIIASFLLIKAMASIKFFKVSLS